MKLSNCKYKIKKNYYLYILKTSKTQLHYARINNIYYNNIIIYFKNKYIWWNYNVNRYYYSLLKYIILFYQAYLET